MDPCGDRLDGAETVGVQFDIGEYNLAAAAVARGRNDCLADTVPGKKFFHLCLHHRSRAVYRHPRDQNGKKCEAEENKSVFMLKHLRKVSIWEDQERKKRRDICRRSPYLWIQFTR